MTISPRVCVHCGSPAKGNPCWWALRGDRIEGDPPCFGEFYDEQAARRSRRVYRTGFVAALLMAVVWVAAWIAFAH